VRAAVIRELGGAPEVADVPDPAEGILVEVLAAPLNPIDLAVASGRVPAGHPPLPYVPGCEAVGRRRDSGELVWVFGAGLGLQRDGGVGELVTGPEASMYPVPADADPAVAAALGIAGVAGWVPFVWRAPVRAGETVLVLGATGTVGFVAVQAARLHGAGRVVAAGRSREGLERAARAGADATVSLDGDDLAEQLRAASGGDGPTLIFDPLWGEPAAAAAEAAAPGARIVQLGQSAGATAPITSAAIRFKGLEILGYSDFTVPREVMEVEYARLVQHATAGDIEVDVERVPLEDVAEAWSRQASGPRRKLVLVP
jgi:NADPH2:quinone reductase